MSDIGDIDSPRAANVGGRPTRVDPKLFGLPSEFSGDRHEWRHFEWVFRKWFGFLCDAAEWLHEAASARRRMAKAKDQERTRDQHPTRAYKVQVMWPVWGTRRASVGTVTFKEWKRFRVLPRVQWRRVQRPQLRPRRQQRPFKRSMMRMVDGSLASVTTDKEDLWDELVLDSGSVSRACP